MSDKQHIWIVGQGPGPLVLVRKALLDFWCGVDAPAGQRSDYGRACGVSEIGCLDMKGGTALVLGDEPLRTTWLPKPQGGMFVRWIAGDDETSALAALETGADATWTPTGCSFTTAGGEHVLFPAAETGANAATECLKLELREGDYDVLCAVLDGGSASVLVYRLIWRPKTKMR